MSSTMALSNAPAVAISRASRPWPDPAELAGHLHDPPRCLLVEGLAVGRRGQDGPVAGQGQADRLGQAVHAVGGEHPRATAAGGAGGLLDLLKLRLGELA